MQAAIVTGASRGLGLALCQQLLQQGFKVVGIARQSTEAWQQLAKTASTQLNFIAADLADSNGLHGVMAEALQWLHQDPLEQLLLINNAGVVTPIARAGYYPEQQLTQAIALNLTAPMLLTDAFLRLSDDMDSDRRVVCISSGAAVNAYPGWGVYGSSKAGLDHFCRHVMVEQLATANPARIVSVYPGVVDTDMQANIRASDPQQFPNKARFDALKAEGALSTPQAAASKIVDYALSERFGSEAVIDIRNL